MKLFQSIKPIHIVLALLLVVAAITGYVLTSEPPAGATGMPHETIAGLAVGGEGAERLSSIGRAPFYFQIAVIALAGALLYMGVAPHRRDHLLRVFFAAGMAFALFVWGMLYFGYEDYLLSGETTIIFGFPAPTNWMFWGVWGSFALFDLFYVLCFRRYFLPEEDEQAFHAFADEMKTGREGE